MNDVATFGTGCIKVCDWFETNTLFLGLLGEWWQNSRLSFELHTNGIGSSSEVILNFSLRLIICICDKLKELLSVVKSIVLPIVGD